MNDMLQFRKASAEDAARILEIIRQAQAQMRAAGSLQWQNGFLRHSEAYPLPLVCRKM